MSLSQLTITADEKLIERARRAAEARGTNLSDFLIRALDALAGGGSLREEDLPPLTRRALGLARGIPDDDRESVTDAVEEKQGRLT